MSPSIFTKAFSLGAATVVTLTIMMSMDALATSQQSAALLASESHVTQTACVPPAAARRS